MKNTLRVAVVVVTLLAVYSASTAQQINLPPFGRVIGMRVDSTYLTGDGGRYLGFSKSGQYVAVGGAVYSWRGPQLGPVFRDRSQEVLRLAFHFLPEAGQPCRVFAPGRRLTLWEIAAKAPAPGSVLPFSDWNATPATNPSFTAVQLPDSLTRLDARQALTVSPDGEHIVAAVSPRVQRWSLKTGKVVAEAQAGARVSRIYSLGKDGPFLLWSPNWGDLMRTWDGDAISVDTLTEPPSPVKGRNRLNPRYPPAISPDGKMAVELVNFSDGDHWVYVWDLKRRQVREIVPGFKKASAITCLVDGRGYAVGYRSGRIEIRDLNHRVIEVVAEGTPESELNYISEMATGLEGRRLAVYHPHGQLVLYERGATAEQPKNIVAEFPARIGARWVYKHTVQGQSHGDMIFEIGGVEAIGTDHCFRVDRYLWRNGQIDHFRPESLMFTYRPDGLYWAGMVRTSESSNRFFVPPVLTLPADRTNAASEFTSRYSLNAVDFKLRFREETINVPYRSNIGTIRVDRNMSKEVTQTESIWFAKDIGIVKWQDVTHNTLLELKSYTAGK